MRVLVAPDKFKGSLSARQVAEHVAAGLTVSELGAAGPGAADPGVEVDRMPVADGGDGTVDAALAAGYRRVPVRVSGPTGAPVDTAFAERDGRAVVELADACGLARLPGGVPAPWAASSHGVGEVLRAALDHGARTVVLAIGGSASTDGGAGLVRALGARVLDEHGAEVAPGAAGLTRVHRVDLAGLDPRLAGTGITVALDVDNPLLGPHGAAAVYGPQKGATPADIPALDAALQRWASAVEGAVELSAAADRPGAGAAGGVGYAALTLLGATPRPGIELVLDLVGFAGRVAGADLVVTGEGALDDQTLHGKAPSGVAAAARAAGVPVVAVCGRNDLAPELARAAGFAAVHALGDVEPDPARCLAEAGPLLERLAGRLLER